MGFTELTHSEFNENLAKGNIEGKGVHCKIKKTRGNLK
jgi:hypothetical protein